jgi:epoxyqueuosine reductase
MIDQIKTLAEENNSKLEIVSVDKIKILENEIKELQKTTELNGSQKWILDKLIRFILPQYMKSVIIVAVPRLAYANITFNRNGKSYAIYGTVSAPLDKTQKYISTVVKKLGYKCENELRLPLKRLAVQSGLAEYGKNNITYVEGMGCFLSYVAFSTDIPCKKDTWRKVTVSKDCANCDKCIKSCPVKAIRKDNFLIDNEKCLSAHNESTNDFPEWLPDTVHHTPFDCLKCQINCPINKKYLNTTEVSFDESETKRIIKGAPYKDVSKELKNKIALLELDKWKSIPRNLVKLFDLMDKGHIPSLK